MRKTRKGLVTKCEIVTEIDVNNRVKTDTYPRKFRPLLKLIKPSMTSMNSNDIITNISHSENSISQYHWMFLRYRFREGQIFYFVDPF